MSRCFIHRKLARLKFILDKVQWFEKKIWKVRSRKVSLLVYKHSSFSTCCLLVNFLSLGQLSVCLKKFFATFNTTMETRYFIFRSYETVWALPFWHDGKKLYSSTTQTPQTGICIIFVVLLTKNWIWYILAILWICRVLTSLYYWYIVQICTSGGMNWSASDIFCCL